MLIFTRKTCLCIFGLLKTKYVRTVTTLVQPSGSLFSKLSHLGSCLILVTHTHTHPLRTRFKSPFYRLRSWTQSSETSHSRSHTRPRGPAVLAPRPVLLAPRLCGRLAGCGAHARAGEAPKFWSSCQPARRVPSGSRTRLCQGRREEKMSGKEELMNRHPRHKLDIIDVPPTERDGSATSPSTSRGKEPRRAGPPSPTFHASLPGAAHPRLSAALLPAE